MTSSRLVKVAMAPLTEMRPDGTPPEESRPSNPALFWVVTGAAWVALMVYVWAAWIISGDFKTNTTGRGEEPRWYVYLIHSWEIFALIVSLIILWYYVIRPKVKTGHFTFDSLFFIACASLCFQEPWINWNSLQFLYSTTSINFGSWTAHIPGWSSPNSELVPLSLWALSAYFWLVGIPAYAGSRFMGWMRTHRPGLSRFNMIALTYLAFCVFDVILESFITRTQLFNYGSTVPSLTLWAGTDHQFPIYETISWAGTYTVLTSLHYFRNDRGLSLPERGVEKLRFAKGRTLTAMKLLAIIAAAQFGMLLTYNIPYSYWGMHAVMAPTFVQQEWRTAGVCGRKTSFDCPGPGVPMARIDSSTNRTVKDSTGGMGSR